MRPRRAEAALVWDGAAVTTDMIGSKGAVTYTDPGGRRIGHHRHPDQRPGRPVGGGLAAPKRGHPHRPDPDL